MTRFQSNLQGFWKRISASPRAWQPRLNAFEQTRASWARPIASYEQVPPAYRSFLAPYQAQGREFPRTVLTPSYEGFIHRTTEKLLCDLGEAVAVLEKSGETCQATCYPMAGISCLEIRTVLLDSHLKISGLNDLGVHTTSTLRFNTVTDHLLRPLAASMRRGAAGFNETGHCTGAGQFDNWVHLSYKFMNFARHSLLPGENVVQAILQLEIKAPVVSLLGRTFYRTLAPTHAVILTDCELILISEEQRHTSDHYGGIWDFLPLKKIEKLSVSEKEGGRLSLSVELPDQERLECIFQVAKREEVNELHRKIIGLNIG
jgi:hypothetical protein